MNDSDWSRYAYPESKELEIMDGIERLKQDRDQLRAKLEQVTRQRDALAEAVRETLAFHYDVNGCTGEGVADMSDDCMWCVGVKKVLAEIEAEKEAT